ncbi:hypothetical protein D922_02229 [Enterococcus faecalis 06-MB-DW-09]|nr:hypothetical protein D922_02229 [Enterococcus faecalis 06-MB-DW-09]
MVTQTTLQFLFETLVVRRSANESQWNGKGYVLNRMLQNILAILTIINLILEIANKIKSLKE